MGIEPTIKKKESCHFCNNSVLFFFRFCHSLGHVSREDEEKQEKQEKKKKKKKKRNYFLSRGTRFLLESFVSLFLSFFCFCFVF